MEEQKNLKEKNKEMAEKTAEKTKELLKSAAVACKEGKAAVETFAAKAKGKPEKKVKKGAAESLAALVRSEKIVLDFLEEEECFVLGIPDEEESEKLLKFLENYEKAKKYLEFVRNGKDSYPSEDFYEKALEEAENAAALIK